MKTEEDGVSAAARKSIPGRSHTSQRAAGHEQRKQGQAAAHRHNENGMRRGSVRLEDDGEEAGRGGYTADLGEGFHHRAA